MIARRDDELKTDLQVEFGEDGSVDLAWSGARVETVRGAHNLIQALTLRLLVHQNEIAGLGHPRYGSRVRELIGRPLTRANLDLLRRHVRNALRQDPRVREVLSLHVTPRTDTPGAVDVAARVLASSEEELELELGLDLR